MPIVSELHTCAETVSELHAYADTVSELHIPTHFVRVLNVYRQKYCHFHMTGVEITSLH